MSPDASIVSEDGRRREMVAFDVAHQMIVNVCLPRHDSSSLSSSCSGFILLLFSVVEGKEKGFQGENYNVDEATKSVYVNVGLL